MVTSALSVIVVIMSPIGILTALALLVMFPRFSSWLFRAAGMALVLVAAVHSDREGFDAGGAWLFIVGFGLWVIGQVRYRIHKGWWRSRILQKVQNLTNSPALEPANGIRNDRVAETQEC